ncbi:MAG: glycosyltransferase family 2 protein [Rikenellaceae bacterium]
MKPKISIIIPVYNGVSNYLDVALDSIYSQNLHVDTFEVICVDDCSTDDTALFLQKIVNQHSNFTVLTTPVNIRQGGARNIGIKASKGEYIMFLDQDDYFSKGAITEVVKHLNISNLDLLVCDSAWQIRGDENFKLQHNFQHREIMKGDDFLVSNGIPYAPWKFVIKRELIFENNLFFEEGVRIEDVDWSLKLTHYANRMQYIPALLIHYNRGIGSTTWDSYKEFNTIVDTILMSNRVFILHDTIFRDSLPLVKGRVHYIAAFYFLCGMRSFLGIPFKSREKIEILKKYISVLDAVEVSSHKLIADIIKFSPKLYVFITTIVSPLYIFLLLTYRTLKYKWKII